MALKSLFIHGGGGGGGDCGVSVILLHHSHLQEKKFFFFFFDENLMDIECMRAKYLFIRRRDFFSFSVSLVIEERIW